MQIILLGLILASFTAYFCSQNTVGVTLRFANQTLGIFPLYLIIIFSLLLGFLIAYIFSLTDRIRKEREIKHGKKFIQEEEKNLHDLQDKLNNLTEENAKMKIELLAYEKMTILPTKKEDKKGKQDRNN